MSSATDSRRLLRQAKRWSERYAPCAQRSARDGKKCYDKMMAALLGALPPKRDGTHPLDKFKLEG